MHDRAGAQGAIGVAGVGHTHLLARVGRYDLAIPIDAIISIHEAPAIFPMPCAQPGIAGAIQFQGSAVPVFDLRRSLRLEPRPVAYSDRLILLDIKVRLMALIVDEVKQFVSLQRITEEGLDALFGDSPVNVKIVAGIACAPELCAIIDPAGLLQPDTFDLETIQSVYDQVLEPSDPLFARTAALAEIPQAPQATGIEAALFQLAGQRFGVPLGTIVEFFTNASHALIPVRSNIAVSLLNRRGEGVMLFDPRPILGLPPAPMPARIDGIILASDRALMAFGVDKLEGLGVLPHAASSVVPGRFCTSVHASDQGAVLLLDVPAFLHQAQSAFSSRPPAPSAVA
ncbi:MAG: chemotaxis protein CheW [Candidatus Eremiobacteraeota bacterium]|nr:chemotaxis protein CheW [Candidatus Eremiobacteraeota bacterium]